MTWYGLEEVGRFIGDMDEVLHHECRGILDRVSETQEWLTKPVLNLGLYEG